MKGQAFIVLGMGFGDEGKGSVVDWLVRQHEAPLVVRFNGGAQAAHRVVTPKGAEHIFHMFGSGTLAGAETYLSQHVLVNPEVLVVEAVELARKGVHRPLQCISIHPDCPITTPWHVALNRLLELSRDDMRHGSCGLGIGETMVDVEADTHFRFRDLGRADRVDIMDHAKEKMKLAAMLPVPIHGNVFGARRARAWREAMEVMDKKNLVSLTDATLEIWEIVSSEVRMCVFPTGITDAQTMVFEGAQGILLDQDHGYGAPMYTTWSATTGQNAREILELYPDFEVTTLGVTRWYMTRHGRGPFPTEIKQPPESWLDERNEYNQWQGEMRYGNPDTTAVKTAAWIDGQIDGLVVTCLDRTDISYIRRFVPKILAECAGVPLYAASYGPTAEDKDLAESLDVALADR